jgi:predicted deacylase
VSERNITNGVTAILKLLNHIGIIKRTDLNDSETISGKTREILLYSQLPLSSTSGIIRFYTGAGEKVKTGQMIAKIYNAFGKMREVLHAENDGLVLGCSDTSLAFPGFPVMAFGINSSSYQKRK